MTGVIQPSSPEKAQRDQSEENFSKGIKKQGGTYSGERFEFCVHKSIKLRVIHLVAFTFLAGVVLEDSDDAFHGRFHICWLCGGDGVLRERKTRQRCIQSLDLDVLIVAKMVADIYYMDKRYVEPSQ